MMVWLDVAMAAVVAVVLTVMLGGGRVRPAGGRMPSRRVLAAAGGALTLAALTAAAWHGGDRQSVGIWFALTYLFGFIAVVLAGFGIVFALLDRAPTLPGSTPGP
jgi:hypothetical protein